MRVRRKPWSDEAVGIGLGVILLVLTVVGVWWFVSTHKCTHYEIVTDEHCELHGSSRTCRQYPTKRCAVWEPK